MPILIDIIDRILSGRPIRKQLHINTREYDNEIAKIRAEKIREWKERGLSDKLIDYAIRLAEGWSEKMIEWSTRYLPPEMKEQVARQLSVPMFKKALEEVSEPWIKGVKG